MSGQIDLKALQKDVHHTYNSDGILDISVGISLILCAILIYCGIAWLAFAALAAGVSTYYALKSTITMPRTGYVKFTLFGHGIMGRSVVSVAAIILATLIVVILTAIITKETLLALGTIAAATLLVSGYVFDIKRLYAYAAVIVVICVAGRSLGLENMISLPQDIVQVLYILIPGALMLIVGVLMLAMYVGKYKSLTAGEPMMER